MVYESSLKVLQDVYRMVQGKIGLSILGVEQYVHCHPDAHEIIKRAGLLNKLREDKK